MTPKEKAEELLHKCRMLLMNEGEDYGEEILVSILSKKCSLIAVDEIMKCTKYEKQQFENDRFSEDYWQEVKQQIEKL